ncbi:MAG: MBL fold metallo-hydrolase [Actinobacteria bacterium]|jgi:glyoxylase-like metal-dependent hydrolase (beta-lactamase superfamily II)|nr:MBL fold metallo-hydrolase [Actinomycetota bacterium]MBT3686664.1 MBL fold metallo-hydrolase [Actinomycetota bacterium]MBT4037340.1 MBL fold metallo-hydrolase [Actinomycetota bacterium]MBT4278008.1 MBL fold metallo-hydrolase [Actinomycetota bacterium]MBT4343366.1 MBL fold metallo-hydrolase [Actinomycetota bacterium]
MNIPIAQLLLQEDPPEYGRVEQVSTLVRRIVADNPSRFTYHGTATFIVGPTDGGDVAIIDPGPDDEAHVAALLAAVDGQTVTHILVTHTHPDHSPATAAVKAATGATTYGFGPHPEAAIRAHEERIRRAIEAGEDPESDDGEGGGDTDFVPDIALADTDIVAGESFTFECLHTPGHISNHLCFALAEEQTLFTGDHVMGWSTTVIPAPDGDLADYMDGLERLIARSETTYRPTHGPAITDPVPFVTALLAHRRHREDQIVAALTDGPRTVAALVADIYADVDEKLHKAAGASVFAHLLALHRWGRATADPEPDPEAEWAIAQ